MVESEGELFINGQQIEPYKILSDMIEENDLSIQLPNHLVIDRNNCEKWVGDFDDSDAEKLGEVLRMDTDMYVNKKIKIYIQVIGNKSQR